jgi:predicted Zn-dependent peptidase
MSFAEKYKKKEPFTSQALKPTEPAKTENSATAEVKSNSALNKKPVDLQKRMLASLIYLVKGVDAGRNAWYYVLVERNKVQLFLKALNDDIIHLENYGQILFSAYGDEPPAEVTNKLKEEYGID